jgi:hypothetical protein
LQKQPARLPRIEVPALPDGSLVSPDDGVTVELVENLSAAPPRQATRVSVGRTAAYLHLRFQCEDSLPWATISRRNGPLYEEETVEFFFDPFGDLACYFEIEVNPLNTVLDLMLRRVGRGWRRDFEWNCEGLETSVVRSRTGWTARLAIPFASVVATPPGPGTVWRANFFRIDRPPGTPRELSAWSPTRRDTFHDCARFGYFGF